MGVRIVCFREDEPKYELDPGLHRLMTDATYSVVRIYPFSETTGENGQFKGWVLSFDSQEEFDAVDISAFVDRIEDQLVEHAMLTDRPMMVDLETAEISLRQDPRGRTVLYSIELDSGVREREAAKRMDAEEHDAMLATLADQGISLESVAELVNDYKASEAAEINYGGLTAQLAYLREQGCTANELIKELKGSSSVSLSM